MLKMLNSISLMLEDCPSLKELSLPEGNMYAVWISDCPNLEKMNFPACLEDLGLVNTGIRELDVSRTNIIGWGGDITDNLKLEKIVFPHGFVSYSNRSGYPTSTHDCVKVMDFSKWEGTSISDGELCSNKSVYNPQRLILPANIESGLLLGGGATDDAPEWWVKYWEKTGDNTGRKYRYLQDAIDELKGTVINLSPVIAAGDRILFVPVVYHTDGDF